jgi:hypothetical protein
MSHTPGAVADAPTSSTRPSAIAAELAARIPIPIRLPERCDGEPIRHLSHSSYLLWQGCPDAWRRRYILRQRQPQTVAMFLGSRVDDALSDYHRHLLDSGEQLTLDEVLNRYRTGWSEHVEVEQQRADVVFDEFDQPTAVEIGAAAIKTAFRDVIPNLGMAVAVQRRVELTLAPGLEWTVEGYLDLETQWPRADGELTSEIVDYKLKGGNAIGHLQAARDPQASLYLALRWLEGQPADQFTFAQILRQGRKRQSTSTSLVKTTRTVGQMRATLARIALAASQIVACHDRFGPDRPWGFADPTGWRCTERFCHFWDACPGGAGL